MNKRIIIVGPSAAGKTFLREKLESKGFEFDVSYTSRPIRDGEVDGVHYNFISRDKFIDMIGEYEFYEYVKYNGHYYGTGEYEWNNMTYFILETDGVAEITKEDRKNCFIIYLNPAVDIRRNRMAKRNWDIPTIEKRIETDKKKFDDFKDFDIEINDFNIK